MQQQTFKLTGLTCKGCAEFTTKRIKTIEGVTAVSVDLPTMKAVVSATRRIAPQDVRSVLDDSNYGVA